MDEAKPMLAHDFITASKRPQPSKLTRWYGGLVGLGKFGRVIGVFLASDLLRYFHVCQLLCLLKILASAAFFFIQKPLSKGHPLRKGEIIQLGFFQALVQTLWLYGLTLVGPFRCVLLFETSAPVVAAILATLAAGCRGSPSKVRGTVFMCVGFLSLVLLDRDMTVNFDHEGAHDHQSGLNHLFYHLVNWVGLADHKGGVLVLGLTAIVQLGYHNAEKRLGVELEGGKRAHALASSVGALILTPIALFLAATAEEIPDPVNYGYIHIAVLLVACSVLVFVIDFYVEAVSLSHLNANTVARYAPILMYLVAFVMSYVWFGEVRQASPLDFIHGHGLEGLEHGLSGGAVLATLLFSLGCLVLTAAEGPRARAGEFIGYDSAGSPLYLHGEDFLKKTTSSAAAFARATMGQIWASPDSRAIFYFLCLNLAFCGVEFLYGVLTNSLGLISDAFHMLFDCTALVMGLVASVMSRWKATGGFSYGYGRVEVLSGFINALFLVVISFFILVEALQRLYDPPHVHAEKLFVVSVLGLLINVFGLWALGHNHSHGGKECGGGGGDHGHAHGGNDHGHSHAPSHRHSHGGGGGGGGGNANMKVQKCFLSWASSSTCLVSGLWATTIPMEGRNAGVGVVTTDTHTAETTMVTPMHPAMDPLMAAAAVAAVVMPT